MGSNMSRYTYFVSKKKENLKGHKAYSTIM